MTWDEMVLIQAKRIAEHRYDDGWCGLSKVEKQYCVLVATAALLALREAGVRFMPAKATEEMQRCGGAVLDHPSVYMGGASPRSMTSATAVYRAMRSTGEIKPEDGK